MCLRLCLPPFLGSRRHLLLCPRLLCFADFLLPLNSSAVSFSILVSCPLLVLSLLVFFSFFFFYIITHSISIFFLLLHHHPLLPYACFICLSLASAKTPYLRIVPLCLTLTSHLNSSVIPLFNCYSSLPSPLFQPRSLPSLLFQLVSYS